MSRDPIEAPIRSPDPAANADRPAGTQPALLLLDPDPEGRRQLSLALAEHGNEVAMARDVSEARSLCERLAVDLVIADSELVSSLPGSARASLGLGEGTGLLLLGRRAGAQAPPEAIGLLAVADLSERELARRIHLARIGRGLGLELEPGGEALTGALSTLSLYELVKRLARQQEDLTIELEEGEIVMRSGRPVAARCGLAVGLKAFSRLGRSGGGTFRVRLGDGEAPAPEIEEGLDALLHAAISDSLVEQPDPRTRFRLKLDPGFFGQQFSVAQQQILESAHRGLELGTILDRSRLPDGAILLEIFSLEERGALTRVEPAPRVALLTDSAADLPPEMVRSHRIEVVPSTVRFGAELLLDRFDLSARRFYELLEERRERPSIEPPAASRFAVAYSRRVRTQEVVSIHGSEEYSRALLHARRAVYEGGLSDISREGGGRARLEILGFDQVGIPLGLLALFGARMALRGLGAGEIRERLSTIGPRIRSLLVVNAPEFLARKGQIRRLRAVLSRLTDSKPILRVEKGRLFPVTWVRGRRSAYMRLTELASRELQSGRETVVGIAHAANPVWADRLREMAEERFEICELVLAEVGPALGAWLGPGSIVAAFFQPSRRELTSIAPLEG